MKFDISSMHTIFEEADSSKSATTSPLVKSLQIPVVQDEENDRTGANLDSSLAHADLNKLFDDICPITGNVFAAMKNAAADPHNLKISAVKSGDGDKADLFIEAVEFATFCEASGLTIGEAVDKIIEAYEGQEDIPELDNADFHVVFPSDSLNKNILGGENLGRDVKNDWAMQLMRGCRRYGLKVNAGVEVTPTNEAESWSDEDQKKLDKITDDIKNKRRSLTYDDIDIIHRSPATKRTEIDYNDLMKESWSDEDQKKFNSMVARHKADKNSPVSKEDMDLIERAPSTKTTKIELDSIDDL